MTKVQDIQKVEKVVGTASTIQAKEFVPVYSEAVERFLRDNASLGENWQKQTANVLYDCFKGTDSEGNITGSNVPACAAISTFLPQFSLITGEQLLRLYKIAGNKNPFGGVYVDFGVASVGEPKLNPAQAKVILESLRRNGLKTNDGVVIPYPCLRLFADENSGLVYKIVDGTTQDKLTPVSEFPFEGRIGKNGLFRAFLSGGGGWYADVGALAGSDGGGRVVCYDAEGVASRKLEVPAKSLAETLRKGFTKRF